MDSIREDLLIAHKPLCETHGPQHTVLPGGKDRFMKFTQWGKKLKVPFVIYADLNAFYPLYQKKVEKHTCTNPVDTLTLLWVL